uniref:LOW QUALITY PROTEIN: protein zer-1 homolog n=1 Tax=Styela clava TaxID=7725 RepID=UPI00193A29AB|nr:LOW QUALITY PROTEIN: protein zer-1 homolog [Styela clava]
MVLDISNAMTPPRLEELAIAFIGDNLLQTICRGNVDGDLRLSEGVNLPQSYADPNFTIFSNSLNMDTTQDESESEKLVKYIKIFTDANKCKLRRIKINKAPVSDDVVQVLCDLCEAHSLLEVDLSHSNDTNGDEKDHTPPYNHAVLLPSFIVKLCGKSLQKLILHRTFLAYSINQIMSFSGKKARALKQDVYLTSDATLDHLVTCLSSENAPMLTSLDVSEAFIAWFITIDPENPPPLKVVDFAGYVDTRLNSTIKKILKHFVYGEEDYNLEPGKRVPLIAHSKSERKLAKYPFFKNIESATPMVKKFIESANLESKLNDDLKYDEDYSLEPDSNFVFRQMNLLSLKNTLQQLGLFHTFLSKRDFEEIIFNLKELRVLDVSWPSQNIAATRRFRPQDITLWEILDNLPHLKSLDVSGTYYGENLYTDAEVRGTEKFLKMEKEREPLQFLGLWGTNACKLKEIEKLAEVITGDENEEQLLRCLDIYIDRKEIIMDVFTKLSRTLQQSIVQQPNLLLKLIIKCIYHYPTNDRLLFLCATNLYYLFQLRSSDFSVYQRRDIVRAVTTMLEKNQMNNMLARNCMVIFFDFDLPKDLLFDFDHIAKLILNIFDKRRDESEINFIAGNLCNAMICSMEINVKPRIRDLGFTGIMIDIIKDRLRSGVADDTLDTAWSGLWNATDETTINAEDFINMDGMSLIRQCYEKFEGRNDLRRNLMGLTGNLAEVPHLRPYLAEKQNLDVIVDLVLNAESGIEAAYNACGTLSNLLIDDSDILKDAPVDKIRSDMRKQFCHGLQKSLLM